MKFDPVILCRPAVAADRSAVMSFLKEIWEGDDYVPQEWEEWFYREAGCLAVAEFSGRVLAIGHLLDMGAGEWWLEGLRVDPQAWGQGIGSHLHDYFVERWLSGPGEVVRLATHQERKAVHTMCERTGFEFTCQFTPVSGGVASAGVKSDLVEIAEDQWHQAIDTVSQGPSCQYFGGLMDYQWRFARPRLDRLGGIYDDCILRSPQGVVHIARLELNDPEPSAHLLATSSSIEQLSEELPMVLRWAAEAGAQELTWLAPASKEFLEAAAEAGLEPAEAGTLLIYQRSR